MEVVLGAVEGGAVGPEEEEEEEEEVEVDVEEGVTTVVGGGEKYWVFANWFRLDEKNLLLELS